eukprot:CAMPEP_0181401414 /NCGR_PEP_ID=MMETSP1110-20121109/2635_1 /TAXON_ID=174948 /ORGANISM="Symbiodinium sp., Strain CCMP421" /LENGTH=65 /DNA_ID=CAMNT_0023523577 /DNA_START=156 /DNA_END=350 /DNA_ORIENTATION=-
MPGVAEGRVEQLPYERLHLNLLDFVLRVKGLEGDPYSSEAALLATGVAWTIQVESRGIHAERLQT